MDRSQKEAAVAEIGAELDGATAVFAVDYRGISVPQAAELRGRLREADASFNVVKNRLAKRATAAAGADVLDEHLVGPTALTLVHGDAVLAAKAIADFSKQHNVLTFKGGLMDGTALDADQFQSIARLPGVEVLRGQLVGMAASPLTGIVRTLNGLVSGLASQLGQVADQGLIGGDAPMPEPEPEAKAEPETEVKAEAEAETETEAKDASEPEPEAKPESEPEAEAEPAETTDDEPEAKAAGEDETTSETDDQTSEQADEPAGDDKED